MAGEHLPPPSPRAWEGALRHGLERAGSSSVRFRLIRAEGRRAVAEIDVAELTLARTAWNGDPATGDGLPLSTRRTWGTLVGAKRWLRAGPRAP